ncbi:GTP cyclohydrolase I [Vulcanisaeta thermophila]|uniref:GTP cyclohydrolase I n=1 Tax=Vulcanisaeta thermophila TaxID=867917 RepID=UPI000852F50A|nr:GTP cyclohydrolase I FolE [Vulcanisaeta thermophila]
MASDEEIEREIELHVREILRLLGEDVNRQGLRETPRRFAKALLELTRGLREPEPEMRFFSLGGVKYPGRVLVSNVRFNSLCEHHLLPIIGLATVVYEPLNSEVPGLSKVARYIKWLAARPILQERFTALLANELREKINARYVYVKVCALHMCVFLRGVKDEEMYMVTEAWSGDLSNDELNELRRSVSCSIPRINTQDSSA